MRTMQEMLNAVQVLNKQHHTWLANEGFQMKIKAIEEGFQMQNNPLQKSSTFPFITQAAAAAAAPPAQAAAAEEV